MRARQGLGRGTAGYYQQLGDRYRDRGMAGEMEKMYLKAVEAGTAGDDAYIGLAESLERQGKYGEAAELYGKGIKANPAGRIAVLVRRLYRDRLDEARILERQGRSVNAEEAYLKAAALTALCDVTACAELIEIYKAQGRQKEAAELFMKAAILKKNDGSCAGKIEAVNVGKYGEETGRYYTPVARYNYNKLKREAEKRKIKLVCVEYPMRDIKELKAIIGQGDVLFVDNEGIFKDAVARDGFDAYFKDNFGFSFGHCTQKGNQLLARNIADAITEKYFNGAKARDAR
jgi:tetratricopeptide (TPR) repeat protein